LLSSTSIRPWLAPDRFDQRFGFLFRQRADTGLRSIVALTRARIGESQVMCGDAKTCGRQCRHCGRAGELACIGDERNAAFHHCGFQRQGIGSV
jgi:hypothetical protein